MWRRFWFRALVLFCTISTVGLAMVGWFFFGDAIRERLGRRPFEPVAWKASHLGSTNEMRIRMVDDLLRRHKFHGATRPQVATILGEPDDTPYFRNWDLVYWLGRERGFISIDSEWLVFRLGPDQTVADYRIVRD